MPQLFEMRSLNCNIFQKFGMLHLLILHVLFQILQRIWIPGSYRLSQVRCTVSVYTLYEMNAFLCQNLFYYLSTLRSVFVIED